MSCQTIDVLVIPCLAQGWGFFCEYCDFKSNLRLFSAFCLYVVIHPFALGVFRFLNFFWLLM